MNFQKIKAVILDLDGTLLDTLADIGTGANFALCQFGYQAHPLEEYRALIGHGIKTLLGKALPADATQEDVAKVNSVYQQYYPAHCTVYTDYFPGVMEFLRKLEEKGIRLAVLSNKTETTCKKVVSHYFSDVPWEFIWGNDGERPLKPKKEAGILACELLYLQPGEIVYVGDGDSDMEFAKAVGFIAAGVTWGNRFAEQLMEAGADFLSDSFEELYHKLHL